MPEQYIIIAGSNNVNGGQFLSPDMKGCHQQKDVLRLTLQSPEQIINKFSNLSYTEEVYTYSSPLQ
jgi:hypothetical protein